MSASSLYRIASVLIVLFALGHTLGFDKLDPAWKAESVVAGMRDVHFSTQGFTRSYWDFYKGFGLFVSVFLLLAAGMAWQLGALNISEYAAVRFLGWGLAACFGVVLYLSWRYFFAAPVLFSALIFLLLLVAALRKERLTEAGRAAVKAK